MSETMTVKEIKLLTMRNYQDCLMINIGEVCKASDSALPFTIKKNELMQMYLCLDDQLKQLLKAIDDLEAKDEEVKEDDKE